MVPAYLFIMGKLVVEDKSNIKSIIFKYPDIMSKDAKYAIIGALLRENEIKNKLWELRQQIYSLEDELKKIQEFKSSTDNLYNVEYGSKEIDEIKGDASSLLIKNDSDYRNK